MSDTSDQQASRWITPREAIQRLGEDRTERDILKQLVTDLPFTAVRGHVRSDGFSINGILQNNGSDREDLAPHHLENLRVYLAAAMRQDGDSAGQGLSVEICDLDAAGGLIRLRVCHLLSGLGDLGEPVPRVEEGVILFSQIRFDEQKFLQVYPNASIARPIKRGARGGKASLQMTDEDIARWIRSCGFSDVKSGWIAFRDAFGERSSKKSTFEGVWREVYQHRGRGRPKKVS
jgi:hypothetical protein